MPGSRRKNYQKGTAAVIRSVLSALLAAIGVCLLVSELLRSGRCTERTVGTVTDVRSKTRSRGGRSRSREYYPVLEYTVGGEVFRETADISSFFSERYRKGTQMEIRFNPARPTEFMVCGKSLRSGLFIGTLLLLIGAALLYLNFS